MELPNFKYAKLTALFNMEEKLSLNQCKLALSCCELCQGTALIHPLLCQYCLADLPRFIYPHSQYNLLNWPAINTLFPRRHFEQLLVLAPYIWPVDNWLKQLKFYNRFELADLLGFLLNDLWQKSQNHQQNIVLMSVPSHITNWQRRGYNQAHLIAQAFARYAQITYLPNALVREKSSKSQVNQSGYQRRRNLKNAFTVSELSLAPSCRVLLLDDVVTTGTTINTIAGRLRKQGIESISVITVALTLPKY